MSESDPDDNGDNKTDSHSSSSDNSDGSDFDREFLLNIMVSKSPQEFKRTARAVLNVNRRALRKESNSVLAQREKSYSVAVNKSPKNVMKFDSFKWDALVMLLFT